MNLPRSESLGHTGTGRAVRVQRIWRDRRGRPAEDYKDRPREDRASIAPALEAPGPAFATHVRVARRRSRPDIPPASGSRPHAFKGRGASPPRAHPRADTDADAFPTPLRNAEGRSRSTAATVATSRRRFDDHRRKSAGARARRPPASLRRHLNRRRLVQISSRRATSATTAPGSRSPPESEPGLLPPIADAVRPPVINVIRPMLCSYLADKADLGCAASTLPSILKRRPTARDTLMPQAYQELVAADVPRPA